MSFSRFSRTPFGKRVLLCSSLPPRALQHPGRGRRIRSPLTPSPRRVRPRQPARLERDARDMLQQFQEFEREKEDEATG